MTKPKYAAGERVRIRRPRKVVLGAPDRISDDGVWIGSWTVDRGDWIEEFYSLSGRLWHAMNGRCNPDGAQQKNNPRYVGCQNRFDSYQHFAGWCNSQYGYGLKDGKGLRWELDKDIIAPGNRHYGPEVCCFVPKRINSLLTFASKSRGDLPLGVSIFKGKPDVFRSRVRLGGGATKHLGIFTSASDAHRAWQLEKSRIIKEEACLLPSEMRRVSLALLRQAAMIDEDIRNETETVR